MVDCASDTLVQRQIRNEEEIIDQGITKYRKALVEAEGKGTVADTLPGRWITSYYIEPIVVKIRGHVHDGQLGESGPLGKHVCILNKLKADACAFIALRTILNSVVNAKGPCEKFKVQRFLTEELIDELQFNYMEDEDTQAYKYWTREMDRAPDPYTKMRCLKRLKRNFDKLPNYKTDEDKKEVSATAELLIRFTLEATGIAHIRRMKKRNVRDRPDFLVLNPEFRAQFDKLSQKAETLWPKYDPMVCPPRPWTGGYREGQQTGGGCRAELCSFL